MRGLETREDEERDDRRKERKDDENELSAGRDDKKEKIKIR